jgi:hypothetical protein
MNPASFLGCALFAGAGLLLGLALPAFAKPIQDKATSTVEIDFPDGVMRVQTRTSGFTVASYWPEGASDPVHVLLQQRVDITQREDAEGPEQATVALAAWRVDDGAELTPVFDLETAGEAARIENLAGSDAYVAIDRYGCCGALDTTKLYSLESGALLMEYVGAPAWLEVPNSRGLARLAGIDTAWSASANPLFGADPSLVAILAYSTRTAPLRQVAIRLTGGTVDAVMSEPELAFAAEGAEPDPHFVLWSADGRTDPKAITGAALRVTFTPEHVAVIPILADELDLANATTTGGLALAPLPQD